MSNRITCLEAVFVDLQNQIEPDDGRIIAAYNAPTSVRPRTALMVKGLPDSPFETEGLIAMAARKAVKNKGQRYSDRYVDIGFGSGNWWRGESRWMLIVEIENDWRELMGTLADLQNNQSPDKWGVFYREDPKGASNELLAAVRGVRKSFERSGFLESPKTRYEVVVLPEQLPTNGGFRNLPALVLTFEAGTHDGDLAPRLVTIRV
jgi:hypothetical protein